MKIHMVKKGDTMYLIARKYNIPLEELIKANPEIADPDKLNVGMKVKIPSPPKPTYELIHQHKVLQGDSLWKLSKVWGIPLADMIKANPQLKNPNVLLTGEIVNIPKIGGAPAPAAQAADTGFIIPEKKYNGVKAEEGALAGPVHSPAPLPGLPPAPPAFPAAELSAAEFHPPYPMPYPQDQSPVAFYPVPTKPGTQDAFPFASEPPKAHEYGQGYGYGPGYDDPHEHGQLFGHGYGIPYGHVPAQSLEGAMSGVYDPAAMTGYGAPSGYGDISQSGATEGAAGPTGAAIPGPWQGVSGYLPGYVPGQITPDAFGMKAPGGCQTCGGSPIWPAGSGASAMTGMPGGEWPPAPAVPAGGMTTPAWGYGMAAVPGAGGASGGYPGLGEGVPMPYPAAGAYPYGMQQPGAGVYPPTLVSPSGMPAAAEGTYAQPAYGNVPAGYHPPVSSYPVYGSDPITATNPAAGYQYPYYGYDGYVYPTYGAYSAYGFDPYPAPFFPAAVPSFETAPEAMPVPIAAPEHEFQAVPAAGYPAWNYGHYSFPCPDDFGIPPFPPIPPMPPIPPARPLYQPGAADGKRDEGEDGGESSALSLHANASASAASAAVPARKRKLKTRRPSSASRRPKSRRKESLPWIKW